MFNCCYMLQFHGIYVICALIPRVDVILEDDELDDPWIIKLLLFDV